MKKTALPVSLFLCLLSVFVFSCKKAPDTAPSSMPVSVKKPIGAQVDFPRPPDSVMILGTWRVSHIYDCMVYINYIDTGYINNCFKDKESIKAGLVAKASDDLNGDLTLDGSGAFSYRGAGKTSASQFFFSGSYKLAVTGSSGPFNNKGLVTLGLVSKENGHTYQINNTSDIPTSVCFSKISPSQIIFVSDVTEDQCISGFGKCQVYFLEKK